MGAEASVGLRAVLDGSVVVAGGFSVGLGALRTGVCSVAGASGSSTGCGTSDMVEWVEGKDDDRGLCSKCDAERRFDSPTDGGG